jgi:hypothetical protein
MQLQAKTSVDPTTPDVIAFAGQDVHVGDPASGA